MKLYRFLVVERKNNIFNSNIFSPLWHREKLKLPSVYAIGRDFRFDFSWCNDMSCFHFAAHIKALDIPQIQAENVELLILDLLIFDNIINLKSWFETK